MTYSKSHSCNKRRFETPELVPLVWEATTMIFCLGGGLSFEATFKPVNLSLGGKETCVQTQGGHCYFGPLEGS